MIRYYELVAKDGAELPAIFKHMVDGRLTVRPQYNDYTCCLCGRVDVESALATTGIDSAYPLPLPRGKRDVYFAFDYMYIISNKMRSLIEDVCDAVDYYDIQNKGEFFVIWPKEILVPDESNAFDRSDKCELCNICGSTVFGPGLITNIPNVMVGAI